MEVDGHVTEDPEEADYFFIPHPMPFGKAGAANTTRMLEVQCHQMGLMDAMLLSDEFWVSGAAGDRCRRGEDSKAM